ncbi:MmcQ/YjbR family DNA-binding protein [Sinosporangium siamense]|uniref:MmcQ/YjbR family DNA-binding protein n=1 Tax=Sinosporangium siamense TaxID=1367973 RepID=A0A919RNZ0_9ACTN|nr:MmcQ/YjbR family DNA-binding protein [Sinosporangium siamense]GII95711.1 hypothetical protein Ssi02_59420 [Sinosporangium siamense]
MSDWQDTLEELRAFALGMPEAYEDHPWGDTVVKVNKKIFLFLGPDNPTPAWEPRFTVKLPDSHGHALSLPGATPTAYGLGRSGWVTIPLTEGGPGTEVFLDWVDESYRSVAPKRLVAQLDTP